MLCQTDGGAQTLGRFVLESEYFVPALVKFISMDVSADCAVTCSEMYLVSIFHFMNSISCLSFFFFQFRFIQFYCNIRRNFQIDLNRIKQNTLKSQLPKIHH